MSVVRYLPKIYDHIYRPLATLQAESFVNKDLDGSSYLSPFSPSNEFPITGKGVSSQVVNHCPYRAFTEKDSSQVALKTSSPMN